MTKKGVITNILFEAYNLLSRKEKEKVVEKLFEDFNKKFTPIQLKKLEKLANEPPMRVFNDSRSFLKHLKTL